MWSQKQHRNNWKNTRFTTFLDYGTPDSILNSVVVNNIITTNNIADCHHIGKSKSNSKRTALHDCNYCKSAFYNRKNLSIAKFSNIPDGKTFFVSESFTQYNQVLN